MTGGVSRGAGLYLIIPGFPTQHLGALEARRQTLGGERGALWEKRHVDALAEVNEDEAVVQVLWLEAPVLQEPGAHGAEHDGGFCRISYWSVHDVAPTSPPAGSCQA